MPRTLSGQDPRGSEAAAVSKQEMDNWLDEYDDMADNPTLEDDMPDNPVFDLDETD